MFVSSWGDHPPAEVTPRSCSRPAAVTPSTWEEIMSDCIQGRQEILGVLAELDPGIPPADRFPHAEAHIGEAIGSLRKAIYSLNAAIETLTTESGKG